MLTLIRSKNPIYTLVFLHNLEEDERQTEMTYRVSNITTMLDILIHIQQKYGSKNTVYFYFNKTKLFDGSLNTYVEELINKDNQRKIYYQIKYQDSKYQAQSKISNYQENQTLNSQFTNYDEQRSTIQYQNNQSSNLQFAKQSQSQGSDPDQIAYKNQNQNMTNYFPQQQNVEQEFENNNPQQYIQNNQYKLTIDDLQQQLSKLQGDIQNQKQQYKILENSQIQLQIIKVELQKNYEELQYKYEELEQKYQAEVQTNNELKRSNQNLVEQQALNLEMKDQILYLQKENQLLKKQKEDLILQIQKENQLLKMEKEDQNYQCKGQNDQINKQQLQTHNEQMKYNQQEIKPERNKQNYNKRSTQDQPENLNVNAIQEEKQEITKQNNYEKTKSRVRQTINSPQKTRQQQQQQQQKDSQLNAAQQNQQSESIQKQIFKIEEVQIKTEFTNHCGHLITEQQLKIALNQSIKYKGQPYCPKCAKDIIDWQIHFPLLRQKFKDEIDQTNLERLIKFAEIKFIYQKDIQIAKCPKCNFVCFWDSKILSCRYNSYCQKCEYSTVKNPYK